QKSQPERDLLQRAGRDRSHENRIGQRAVKARNRYAARQGRIEGAARQRGDGYGRVATAHGVGQAADMPIAALLLEEERNARSTAGCRLSGSLRRRSLEQVRQRGTMSRCRDWKR